MSYATNDILRDLSDVPIPQGYSPSADAYTPANADVAGAAADIHAPAANTAAVVTYAAGAAGVHHVISGVAWSYAGAAPTGGNLKIEDGSGTTVFSIDITAEGPGFFTFPVPKAGSAATAMIVTLAAGGAGVTGKVSVLNHWTVS